MKFELIDRIMRYVPGESLQAVKTLSLAEEYLQDHFPGRPVMPGVLMIETMVQACAWLIRLDADFVPSIVVLKEARKVNYIGFVRPGDALVVDVSLVKKADGRARFKGVGTVNGERHVTGILDLAYYSLSEADAAMAETDARLREAMRRRYRKICLSGTPAGAATSVDSGSG